MVGMDANAYSEQALEWALSDMLDDGDEIICLRVISKDKDKLTSDRSVGKQEYRKEAKEMMERITKKYAKNLHLSIIVELAIGQVKQTFTQMV